MCRPIEPSERPLRPGRPAQLHVGAVFVQARPLPQPRRQTHKYRTLHPFYPPCGPLFFQSSSAGLEHVQRGRVRRSRWCLIVAKVRNSLETLHQIQDCGGRTALHARGPTFLCRCNPPCISPEDKHLPPAFIWAGEVTIFCHVLTDKISRTLFCLLSFLLLFDSPALQPLPTPFFLVFGLNHVSIAAQIRF